MTGGSLPESALGRLFEGYEPADLAGHPGFVASRLLEHGDSDELRWLFSSVGESAVAAAFVQRGGRLDRRDRAFWSLVLAVEARPPAELASVVREVTWSP